MEYTSHLWVHFHNIISTSFATRSCHDERTWKSLTGTWTRILCGSWWERISSDAEPQSWKYTDDRCIFGPTTWEGHCPRYGYQMDVEDKGICDDYFQIKSQHDHRSVASLGSRHWERDGREREQGKVGCGSCCYGNNVVSLQINIAGIMAMNRVDRIVLDPIWSERTPVPVQPVRVCGSQCPSLSKGVY